MAVRSFRPTDIVIMVPLLLCSFFMLKAGGRAVAGSTEGPQIDMHYKALGLGDSYTIGESVPAGSNFPNQAARLLREGGLPFDDPEIVAKTGWTTDELAIAMKAHRFSPPYDWVTLLIGVNNQYRGRTVDDFKPEFKSLLEEAIAFSGNRPDRVVVLSIPDWSVTPFASGSGRDLPTIASEIDAYNAAIKTIAADMKVHWLDVTTSTRQATQDPSRIANDGLHPSSKEYAAWAGMLAAFINADSIGGGR
jgi:lysophospholipase L1-like esterase